MAEKKYEYVKKSTYFNGKRYYVRGKTEREARKKLAALEAELAANGDKLDGKTTVRKWSEEWVDVYVKSRDITAKSIAMYQQKLDNYILPEIGTMRLCDVKDIHLKRLINGCNSSYSTAQKVRVVTQAMFKQARKSRLIPFDPSEDLELPKAPKGKRKSITDAERHLDIQMGAEVYRNQIKKHCWEVNWQIETEEQWKALVPYSLRHTYCTDLQRAGVPFNVAKYLMGHSDISVTGNTYTDETPDVVFGAVEKLENFLESPNKKPATQEMEDMAEKIS